MTSEMKCASKQRTLITDWRLVVAFLMVATSCSAGQVVDTGATGTEATDQNATDLLPAVDGLPGYGALRSNGCEGSPPETIAVASWYGWMPIQELVRESNLAIEGTVISVSEPRVSSTTEAALRDGPSLTYFRILTVAVDQEQTLIRNGGKLVGETEVDVLLIGAGTTLQDDDLCYGRDGSQDDREIPLEKGDAVVVVGTLTSEFPIVGLKGDPVVFLTSGFVGLWKVEDDGKTQSVIDEFALDIGELRVRLADEFEAADAGESLELDDLLTNMPDQEEPKSPSTTAPPPPGVDAPDSPTIVPPTEPEE